MNPRFLMQRPNPTNASPETIGESSTDPVLRSVFASIPDGVLVIDDQGIIRYANPAAEQMLGFSPGELPGTFLGSIVSAFQGEEVRQPSNVADIAQESEPAAPGWDAWGKARNGAVVRLWVSCAEIPGSTASHAVILHRQKPGTETAEPGAELLCRALHQSPNPTLIVTPAGRVIYANAAFENLASTNPLHRRSEDASWQSVERELAGYLKGLSAEESYDDRMERQADQISPGAECICPVRNDVGDVTHFLVVGQTSAPELDSTRRDLEESEQRFRKVAEMAGEWLWEQDAQGCYTYSSSAVFDILGYRPEDMLGRSYLDLLTPEDRRHWLGALPHAPNIPRRFHRLTNRYLHRDGHEVFTESSGEPLLDAHGEILKWWGVDHDITARKRVEDALHLRDRAIAAAHIGISILDARRQGYPLIYANPAFCSLTGYSEHELLDQPPSFFPGPGNNSRTVESLITEMESGTGGSVTVELSRRDGSRFWGDMMMSTVKDASGRTTHFIWLVTDVTERKRAADARRELETARRIQASLLPKKTLRTAGIEAAGIFLPAGEIGGDYFDYFATPNGVNVTIADVSGHNVGAALIMTETRSALRANAMAARAAGQRLGASKMLSDLNRLLFEDLNGADLFITMLFLDYDHITRRLTFANAGHNPGLVARPDASRCSTLDAEGLILGVHPEVRFEEKSLLLKPGDVVLLYTDGVTEARDQQGEMFGTDRLGSQLIACRELPVEELIQRLVVSVRTFASPSGLQDDTSMVALRIL